MEVAARKEIVWAVLTDSTQLPFWAPAVARVESCADAERVGATRTCEVTLGAKSGRMVERCVEVVRGSKIAYVVDEESFGMTKLLDGYGFAIELAEIGSNSTEIVLSTFYEPRHSLARLADRLILRRRLAAVCEDLVAGLVHHVERSDGQRSDQPLPDQRLHG